jgi:uncharacterized membrane protein
MTLNKYRLIEFVVIIVVMGLTAWSVMSGIAWIPVPAFVAGIVIGLFIRKGVKKIAVDERVNTVAEKALSVASAVFIILAAPIGLTFIALGLNDYPDLEPVGFTLAFSACAVVLIYYIANIYYNRKLGGKE